MSLKKGFVHHLFLYIILIAIFAAPIIYFLMSKGYLKKPSFLPSQKPTVELKTAYKNPFTKEAQYVNPFNEFKNPFNNL